MKTKIILFVMVLFTFACSSSQEGSSRVDSLPFYQEATFTPEWISPDSSYLDNYHQIPPFELVNQLGDTITEISLANKIYVADFFFTTCPGICPKMTTNMTLLQEAFLNDNEVLLVSHSVTPEIDNVDVLKSYADIKGVNPKKWHLLTGDRSTIYNLGRKSYFVEEDQGLEKDIDEFLHTENFVLIDGNRHIRGIYNGLNKVAITQLITDIKTLKKEFLLP